MSKHDLHMYIGKLCIGIHDTATNNHEPCREIGESELIYRLAIKDISQNLGKRRRMFLC